MSLEYKCDICGTELKMEYGLNEIWRKKASVPVGVGEQKYLRERRFQGSYDFKILPLGRDYLEQLNILHVDLCQTCIDRCFSVIEDETNHVWKWSQQRREKLNAFLADNLRQFKEG